MDNRILPQRRALDSHRLTPIIHFRFRFRSRCLLLLLLFRFPPCYTLQHYD